MELEIANGTILPATDRPKPGKDSVFSRVDPFYLPYASKLCFEPLIQRIEALHATEITADNGFTAQLLEDLATVPALRRPIGEADDAVLTEQADLIQSLLLYVAPPAMREQQLLKISRPFRMDSIFETEAMREIMRSKKARYVIDWDDNAIFCATMVRACSHILNTFYGQQLNIDPPLLIEIEAGKNDLPRYYKVQMNMDFMRVVATQPILPLTETQINSLLTNIYDTDLWLKLLPPDRFEFHGFIIGNLLDITDEEVLSRIKHNLLKRDAILDGENIEALQTLLRTYFRIPELRLGIRAIDYPGEFAVAHQYRIRFDLLHNQIDNPLDEAYTGSIYERACKYRELLLVEDLQALKNPTQLSEMLLAQGIRSILVAPLLNQNRRVIGLVELASPRPYEIQSFVEMKFREILALFRTAVARSRDEVDNRLEAIIREQYTALHPSVEWRFMQAAYNLLQQREAGEMGQAEPVAFEDVYPFYAQADIVDSSNLRNHAIQSDLVATLSSAREMLLRTAEMLHFPLANKVLLGLDKELAHLREFFNSSDETRVLEYLRYQVHPLLEQLGKEREELRAPAKRYFGRLDPHLGVFNRQRDQYETSVRTLNQRISRYLEERDQELQQVIPHYFEKYKSDGVEYEMYAGQSLLRKNSFSEVHLQNLRLSQLIHMCEITRLVDQLAPELPLPLRTAQLIFAYTSPLTISFRQDEKRFDVEGAYNVRYEILKKRIDKATVHGGTERLTQAGHIAIVYLQDRDREEYLAYLDYLRHQGLIRGEVEQLELDALQSVEGLRALRVAVVI